MIEYNATTGTRTVHSPDWSEHLVDSVLRPLGFSLKKPGALADAITWLSQNYATNHGDATPWSDPRTQVAYTTYFGPLNIARLRSVIWEGHRLGFFNGLNHWHDVGAGPAPLLWALSGSGLSPAVTMYEPAIAAQKLALSMRHASSTEPQNQNSDQLSQDFNFQPLHNLESMPASSRARSEQLTVLSYVLNEAPELLEVAARSEAVMILEPSTQNTWPGLHAARERLMALGFSIWAPCPHQNLCPLRPGAREHLDWCHDRIALKMPSWFGPIQSLLPMKNQTVTYSYLLARRSPPPAQTFARLVGDALIEKGKARQLLCQDEKIRYLRWRKKHKLRDYLARGALVAPSDLTNENADKIELDANEAQSQAQQP